MQRRLQEEPKFIAGRRRGTRCCLLTAAVTDSAGRAAAGQGAAASLQQLLPLDDEWLFTFRFWPEHVWEGQRIRGFTQGQIDLIYVVYLN